MRQITPSSRGATLLEYALALPLVLTLTLGALDVSRVLQVQSALNQGTKEALRCLYPTDGGCTTSTYSPGNALYNWYGSTASVGYDLPTFNYDGRLSWFNTPKNTYNNINATVLNSVQFDTPQETYALKQVSFARSQQMKAYVRLTRLPFVMGTSALTPQFRYKGPNLDGNNPLYPGVINVSLGSVDLSSAAGGVTQRSVTFTLSRPIQNVNPALNCRPSVEVDRQGASLNFSDPTDEPLGCSVADLAIGTYGIIHPTGTAYGRGKVTLSISHGNQVRDLGGRVWTGTGNGNFVPRGVAPNGYLASNLQGTYSELNQYQDLELPFNQPITLTFRIYRHPNYPNHTGEWDGINLAVYLPRFAERVETMNCPSILRGVYQSAVNAGLSPPGCTPSPAAMTATAVYVNPSVNVDPTPPSPIGCNLSQLSAMNAAGGPGILANNDIVTTAAQCAPLVGSAQCPQNNGVPELPGADGFIRNSAQALSLCSPAPSVQMQSAGVSTMTNVRWLEAPRRVMSPINPQTPFSFSFTKLSCQHGMTLPEALSVYPPHKLSIGTPEIETVPLYTGGVDPVFLRQTEPALYSCPELTVAERLLDENSSPALPNESLFVGTRDDFGETCWEDTLREHAETLGLPQGVHLAVSRTQSGIRSFTAPPVLTCGQELSTRYEGRGEVLLTAAPLPEGQIPSQCMDGSLTCRAELQGFYGGETSGTVIDEDAAKARALDAIQAAYPQSAPCGDLGEPNCVTLALSRDETTALGHTYRVAASAKVPLALLLGNPIELSTKNERRSEASFIR